MLKIELKSANFCRRFDDYSLPAYSASCAEKVGLTPAMYSDNALGRRDCIELQTYNLEISTK